MTVNTSESVPKRDARVDGVRQLEIMESAARILEKVALIYHRQLDTKYLSRLKKAVALIRSDPKEPSRRRPRG